MLVLAGVFVPSVGARAAPSASSTATITGSFADSCRDFATHASKDISHIEIHYADGRVVKAETIASPDYSIDGGAGDEIDSVDAKSGTTSETFTCTRANGPPTAILEIKTPAMTDAGGTCSFFNPDRPDDLFCGTEDPRTVWTRLHTGRLWWFIACGESTFNFSFRGTSSSDPDSDIASWSIDFGDGASASGDWATNPPSELAHTYDLADFSTEKGGLVTVTLTVTDSAGASDSDALSTGVANACND